MHLLVEKPLAASSQGVQDLLNICAANKVALMVGYNLRFMACLQRFRELLHDNAIGKVLSVRCEVGQNLMAWRPDVDYRKTVSAQKKLGGGVLLELSHEIDYLRWIFGEIAGEIAWIKASCTRQSDLEIDVEDTVHAILGFDAGGLRGSLNMDFVRHDATRMCTAIGEKGTLRWNGLAGEVAVYKEGGADWEALFCQRQDRDGPYVAEWRHFWDCVQGKSTPIITGEDGLRVLHVIEAARESSASGTVVQIRDDS